MTQLPRGRFWLNFSTQNPIPPALNVVQDILECKSTVRKFSNIKINFEIFM